MDQRQKKELAEILQKGVEFECPMSRYTTFRVGGPVEALCIISDLEGLQRMVPYLGREKIPYLVVGRGSNLLVRDDGFRGVAIILREKLANVEPNGKSDQIVLAGGGFAFDVSGDKTDRELLLLDDVFDVVHHDDRHDAALSN